MDKKIGALSIRVSTDDQNNSVEAQLQRAKDYCAYHKITIHSVLIDEDVSGGKPIYKRPGGSKLPQLIENGEINCIVATTVDRIFRDTVDALTTVAKWNQKSIGLHVIDMGGMAVDTSTAAGEMVFTILVAFAKFERRKTGERTKDVLTHKKNKLQPYSPTPFGFRVENRVVDPTGKVIVPGDLVPDEEQQKALEIIKKGRAEQKSFRSIIAQLDYLKYRPAHGKNWHPSTIKQILENSIHQAKAA